MGEIPRPEESKPKSYADQMIEKMNEDLKQRQEMLEASIVEMQRIRDKIARGDAVTKEERDLLEKKSKATGKWRENK